MTVGLTKGWVDTKTNGQKELSLAGHTHSYAASTHTHTKAQITDFPTTMTPAAHTHAAGDVTSGTFDAARIPNLNASKITAGTLPIARGGTGGTTAETARNALGAAAATHTHYDLANKTHNHSNESLNPASIELKGASAHGGYIDFHFGGTTDDYTSRIIESSAGVVMLNDGEIVTTNNLSSIISNIGVSSILSGASSSTKVTLGAQPKCVIIVHHDSYNMFTPIVLITTKSRDYRVTAMQSSSEVLWMDIEAYLTTTGFYTDDGYGDYFYIAFM